MQSRRPYYPSKRCHHYFRIRLIRTVYLCYWGPWKVKLITLNNSSDSFLLFVVFPLLVSLPLDKGESVYFLSSYSEENELVWASDISLIQGPIAVYIEDAFHDMVVWSAGAQTPYWTILSCNRSLPARSKISVIATFDQHFVSIWCEIRSFNFRYIMDDLFLVDFS